MQIHFHRSRMGFRTKLEIDYNGDKKQLKRNREVKAKGEES